MSTECSKCRDKSNCIKEQNTNDCEDFEYDCKQCLEEGFQFYGCSDCCLSEDEYYAEDEYKEEE